ncbi:MAG: alpha/beta hydrolase [Caulobacteraceae bacterium]|nr:alpha/beta hydrolase [Caulobacteraceae bacterium]
MDSAELNGDDVDPEIRQFADAIAAAYAAHGPFDRMSPIEQRQVCEIVRAPWRQGGPVMAVTLDLTVDTPRGPVRVRIHDPTEAGPKPALIYLHGGGWALFSIDTHDRVMREYAARAGVVVVGVDYALAPEHPFPAALEQVMAAARWLRDEGAALGVDADRIAIGGDSAGGNLSVAAALSLRDAGEGELLKAMVLIYGGFDYDLSDEAIRRYSGPRYMLNADEREVFWRSYAAGPGDLDNPLARPILADLHGLPPAFLVIGECDILAEQNLRMAERFRAAGVPVRAQVYPGATHSFIEAVSIAAVARRAIGESADWLAGQLARTAGPVSSGEV